LGYRLVYGVAQLRLHGCWLHIWLHAAKLWGYVLYVGSREQGASHCNPSFLWKAILKVSIMVSEWLASCRPCGTAALKSYLSFSLLLSLSLSLSSLSVFSSHSVSSHLSVYMNVSFFSLSLPQSISLPPSLPPLTFFAVSKRSQITASLDLFIVYERTSVVYTRNSKDLRPNGSHTHTHT
jgi:hypothetical protein